MLSSLYVDVKNQGQTTLELYLYLHFWLTICNKLKYMAIRATSRGDDETDHFHIDLVNSRSHCGIQYNDPFTG